MKAFVIKNKEGKYYSRNLLNPDILFENSIVICEHFATEEIAKFEITFNGLKDCEIVEITITENDLEEQLVEKDKEIAELRQTIIGLYNSNINLEMYSKTIHEQVCDSIRQELRKQFGKHKDKYLYRENEIYNTAISNAISIVYKIEQGEQQ